MKCFVMVGFASFLFRPAFRPFVQREGMSAIFSCGHQLLTAGMEWVISTG